MQLARRSRGNTCLSAPLQHSRLFVTAIITQVVAREEEYQPVWGATCCISLSICLWCSLRDSFLGEYLKQPFTAFWNPSAEESPASVAHYPPIGALFHQQPYRQPSDFVSAPTAPRLVQHSSVHHGYCKGFVSEVISDRTSSIVETCPCHQHPHTGGKRVISSEPKPSSNAIPTKTPLR